MLKSEPGLLKVNLKYFILPKRHQISCRVHTLHVTLSFPQITHTHTLISSHTDCAAPRTRPSPLLSTPDMNIWVFLCAQWKGAAELSGLVVFCSGSNGFQWGVWMRGVAVVVVGVDEGEACSTMPNQPFSPGSRLSVWVRGAPCHRGLAHSSAQCPCQSWQHFLPLLAPALAGIHNISQLPTMACLPAPTIWLLWATILTHITNYSKNWEREWESWGAEEGVCLLVFLL